MLAKDIQVIDLGAENWYNLMCLIKEFFQGLKPADRPGPLLVIYRGLKLLKAIDLGRARPVTVDFHGISRLDTLSRESGFPTILALEESAIARVTGHAQREISYDEDFFKQLGSFARGVAREWGRTIFTYPPHGRPLICPHRALDWAIRLLVPDDTVFLFMVTDNRKPWASAVLGYSGGDLWLLTSLDSISPGGGDPSDIEPEAAAVALGSRYGGTVRVVAVELEAIRRARRSRFPAGTLLWALNTGDLRVFQIPWRWKILAIIAGIRPRSQAPARRGRRTAW